MDYGALLPNVAGDSLRPDTAENASDWHSSILGMVAGGWAEPDSAFNDGKQLVGFRVFIDGVGEGEVIEFVKEAWGPSHHRVRLFDGRSNTAATMSMAPEVLVTLRRKNNGKTRWLVFLGIGGELSSDRTHAVCCASASHFFAPQRPRLTVSVSDSGSRIVPHSIS